MKGEVTVTGYPTSKIIMYVQQLDHLPYENLEALNRRIKQLDYLKRFAWIVHDKDVAEDGSKVEPHVHVTFEFNKAIPLNKLAKALNGEKANYFQKMTRRGQSAQASATNAFRYLVHRTRNAEEKYQYEPKEVHANFKYAEFLKKTEPKDTKADKKRKINKLLKEFMNSKMSKAEVIYKISKVDPIQAGSRVKQVEELEKARSLISDYEWDSGEKEKVVLWFYGTAGTGKTSEAKHILEKTFEGEYFISGGDRDLFENYNNQHGIIIDDFRSSSMPYNEILKMTDPHNLEVEVGSRYHNKKLKGEIYIITCPFSPYKLYQGMQEVQGLETEDSYDQLGRRINMVVHFSKDKIKIEDPNRINKKVIAETDNPIKTSINELYSTADQLIKANFGKTGEELDYKKIDWESLEEWIDSDHCYCPIDEETLFQITYKLSDGIMSVNKDKQGLVGENIAIDRLSEYLNLPERVRSYYDEHMLKKLESRLENIESEKPNDPYREEIEATINQIKEDQKWKQRDKYKAID